jgi:hypothetical protein
MEAIHIIGPNKVQVTRLGVKLFNIGWPCSELRDSRSYWFEFDSNENLVDTDVPESDDGSASVAMSEDCKLFLFDGTRPAWADLV